MHHTLGSHPLTKQNDPATPTKDRKFIESNFFFLCFMILKVTLVRASMSIRHVIVVVPRVIVMWHVVYQFMSTQLDNEIIGLYNRYPNYSSPLGSYATMSDKYCMISTKNGATERSTQPQGLYTCCK